MKKNENLSDDIKWAAVENCDSNYDNKFLYGVITTKIFCRPSCKSKTPLRKNTVFFKDSQEALEKGFRPCKRCRPDLLTYDPNKELIEKVKKTIDDEYQRQLDIKEISKDMGISQFYLIKLFKKYFGCTPKVYISRVRIKESLKLIKSSNLTITEIAYKVGFESIATYYRNFSKIVKCSPKQYRNKSNKSGA